MYRIIASALSDHPNPAEWPTDRVLADPDLEDKGISVYEFATIDEARAFAVEHCAEWLVANVEALIENRIDDGIEGAAHWERLIDEALMRLPVEVRRVAAITVDEPISDISCSGDWVRMETA